MLAATIALVIVFPAARLEAILAFVLCALYVYAAACIALAHDIKHPKLNWTTEQEAVKQNFGVLISMLISWAILILLAVGTYFMINAGWGIWPVFAVLAGTLFILCLVLRAHMYKTVDKYYTEPTLKDFDRNSPAVYTGILIGKYSIFSQMDVKSKRVVSNTGSSKQVDILYVGLQWLIVVAVAVDHGAAHGEILRHMDQGAVDGGVSVGMVFTKAVAHDTGALAVRLVRGGAQLHHGVQDAALDRLEAVLHAGEGTLQDDVLGVGHHAVVHDVLHVDIQDAGGIVLYDRLIVLLLRQGQFPPSCAACWLSGSSKLSGRLKSACSLI